MSYRYYHFKNGLRLVYKNVKSQVAHIGICVKCGSVDEPDSLQGIAHLIEHLIFKGTSKRDNFRILSRLEDVGADLNAFTTKEDSTVYTSIGKQYVARAFELLADILFNSVFPDDEIRKEKLVVLDELSSYKDNPAEWIHDEFEELIFPNHPLGRNILGTRKSLKLINRLNLIDFYSGYYSPSNMVVSVVAQTGFEHILELVNRFFGEPVNNGLISERSSPHTYNPFTRKVKYSRHIMHAIIGNIAFNAFDDRRYALALLNNYLGGPAMNARLNMLLREKSGIAYNIESGYHAFSGTGLFTLYFGTDYENRDKAVSVISKEFADCRTNRWSDTKLNRIKRQAIGQQTLAMQNFQNEMLGMSRSMTLYDSVPDYKELTNRIEKLTADDIIETSREIFNPDQLSFLYFTDRE